MTKSEYQELVEFLGPKFDKIEECLTRIEAIEAENLGLLKDLVETLQQMNGAPI